MKTTFQNLLRNELREQVVPNISPRMMSLATVAAKTKQDVGDFTDLLDRPVEFPDILPKPIDPEGEDNTIPGTPNGLLPGPDINGDGIPDYWYDPEKYPDGIPEYNEDGEGGIPEADRYYQQWIQVTIDGEIQAMLVITTSLVAGGETYNIAYSNGQWQLLANVNGVPVLLPNIFPISITGGSVTWGYQDPQGNFWLTSGDIFSTTPPATWINPTTGGNVGGDSVWYPQGWSVWLDIQFDADGVPIGSTGIPLVPGGGDMPPWNPAAPTRDEGGYSIGIGFSVPFPNQTYGNAQAHRDAWNTWVDAYYGLFGYWPGEEYYPPGHDRPGHWWGNWVKSRPADESW